MTDLSVVVLTWNTRSLTLACLTQLQVALRDVRRRRDWSSEVIVVDNGSTDGTSAELRVRFPEIELQENQANLGFAAGMNTGFKRPVGVSSSCSTVTLLSVPPPSKPAWTRCPHASKPALQGRGFFIRTAGSSALFILFPECGTNSFLVSCERSATLHASDLEPWRALVFFPSRHCGVPCFLYAGP